MKISLFGAMVPALIFFSACSGNGEGSVEVTESYLTVAVPGGSIDYNDEPNSGLPGCYRCSADVADFNADGKLDLVIAGAFTNAVNAAGTVLDNNEVRLYRNDSRVASSIRFVLQSTLVGVRGGGGAIVKTGDFDGDGRSDFAVQFRQGSSPDSNTSAFMNGGNWSFTRRAVGTFDAENNSLGMEAADIDNDGRADLLFIADANGAAPGLWYKYNTTNNQWSVRQPAYGHRMSSGGSVAAGDLNGDGRPDIVVSGVSSNMFGNYNCSASTQLYGQIHLNTNGVISTQESRVLGRYAARWNGNNCSGMRAGGVELFDVDNDGDRDIILAGNHSAYRGPTNGVESIYDFAVLRNDGQMRFTAFENAPSTSVNGFNNGGAGNQETPNIAAGDLTGDGLPEIVIQGHRPDSTGADPNRFVFDSRMYINFGNGQFVEATNVSLPDLGEGPVVLEDFNLDGTKDLVMLGATSPYHPTATNSTDQNTAATLRAVVWRNRRASGNPPPSDAGVADTGVRPDSGVPPDAGIADTGVRPDSGQPDSGQTDSGLADSGARDSGTAVIDAGSGTSDAGSSTTDAGGSSFDAGVIAGCSGPPLVGGGTSGPVNIVEEQGHGLPGCYRCGIASADFDSDGRMDVVMSGPFDSAFTPGMGNYTYQNRVRLYRNTSCPGQEIRFTLQQEVSGVSGGGGSQVVIGDFDGNGLPDFAVQFREGDTPQSDTSGFMNQGGFVFTRRVLATGFDTNSTSLGMAAADFDQDGSDDLAFVSDGYDAGPGLWYRFNISTNTWSAQQTSFTHKISYGGTIAAGDLDGDGYPDIAIGGNSNNPFGNYNCSSTLMYGQIHYNLGPTANPRGISPNGDTLSRYALRANRNSPPTCTGMDNAQMRIADVDNDGNMDIILTGSAETFAGPVGLNGSHYDFVVMRNVDGTGHNFVTFENAGEQLPNGTTNGGTGNLDTDNIALGDLSGDGLPDVFIQGHHRDYANNPGAYVFHSRLFLNGLNTWTELDLNLPDVGEGGQVIEDFNNDGKPDLLFSGASIPFHSNGSNPTDFNNASNLRAYVYRNTRP